jgi:hypothetical protein
MSTPKTRHVFPATGETFGALYAAREWCHANGISYGSLCRDMPVGLMRGDYQIAKWKNLTSEERASCDGLMTSSDFREGDVVIEISEP